MLGAIYAAIGAFTFALNNASMRRGVVTGTVLQGMAITVPVGALGFILLALLAGELPALPSFPATAAAWMAGQGVIHFLIGRAFNYRANQLVGVNLSAPVVQLQVVVAMLLAVVILGEPFTVLQTIGAVVMLAGSFATQRPQTTKRPPAKPADGAGRAEQAPAREAAERPAPFVPYYFAGYVCSACAALCYGVSPLMVRVAFDNAAHKSVIAGAVIAYSAAAAAFTVVLVRPSVRRQIRAMDRRNVPWFLSSAVLVTMSQGFVYASLAVAPLMVVTPILQLSLVFRLILSHFINREYEVLNISVIAGAVAAVIGSILVSLNTDYVVATLALPEALAHALRLRLAG